MAQNRKMDFYFRFPFENMDTTVFVLQPSMKPDAMPQVKQINSTHAYYQSKSWYEAKEHAIYTTSVLVLKRHKIPAKDYAAVRSFFEEVMQDDSQRIVIKRSEAPPVEKKTF